jgi:hypothetical protein
MTAKRYAIRCTPGGVLTDEGTGATIYFDTYVEAEAEAQRLTRAAYSNSRIAGVEMDFTPIEALE